MSCFSPSQPPPRTLISRFSPSIPNPNYFFLIIAALRKKENYRDSGRKNPCRRAFQEKGSTRKRWWTEFHRQEVPVFPSTTFRSSAGEKNSGSLMSMIPRLSIPNRPQPLLLPSFTTIPRGTLLLLFPGPHPTKCSTNTAVCRVSTCSSNTPFLSLFLSLRPWLLLRITPSKSIWLVLSPRAEFQRESSPCRLDLSPAMLLSSRARGFSDPRSICLKKFAAAEAPLD